MEEPKGNDNAKMVVIVQGGSFLSGKNFIIFKFLVKETIKS